MGRKATKTLEERQQVLKIKSFETTLKDKIEEKLLEEKRIQLEIEFIDLEIKRLQFKKSELKDKLVGEVLKNEKVHLKVLNKAIKDLNACPVCQKEHISNVPDECYMKVHLAGYDTAMARAFNAFLKKNKLGSLD